MFRSKSPIALCLAMVLGAAPAFADSAGDKKPERDPQKFVDQTVAKLTKELKLNSDQEAKVRQMFEEGAGRMKDMRPPMPGEMHEEFAKQLRSPSVDTAALDRQFEEHMAKMREHHALMVKRFSELHAVLTSEQRDKLAAFMEKRHEEMMKRQMDHQKGMRKDSREAE
jgi:Spy/CpxP family protein refolding chaperone